MKNAPDAGLHGVTRALVIGGGNTALDVVQELRLLGVPEVTMVYRRSRAVMSGYPHELDRALELGAAMLENRAPVEVILDGEVITGLRVAHAADGRPLPATEEDLPADLIVVATGQARFAAWVRGFPGVETDAKGRVTVDPETGRTGNRKVYAGGDCVNGGKEVVNAVAEGKLAARAMAAAILG
jgi:glutamate synthase (NADPH/NADH) small chain